jgi:hypothetical protein
MRQSGGDTRVGLDFAFETATSRQPDEEEIKILQQLFQTSLTEFQSDPEATKNVMSSALLEQPLTSTDAPTLAAWIAVARALLNLDETITRN